MITEDGSRVNAEAFVDFRRNNIVFETPTSTGKLLMVELINWFTKKNTDNLFLNTTKTYIDKAPISEYFKQQLLYEFGLEKIANWKSWEEVEEKNIENRLGISLTENKYGIFDPTSSLTLEALYYVDMERILKQREKDGMYNPVSCQEWGNDLVRRLHEADNATD
jgi:hypothetical protein